MNPLLNVHETLVQLVPVSRPWDRLPVLMRAAEEEERIKIMPWAPPQCRNSQDRVSEDGSAPVTEAMKLGTNLSERKTCSRTPLWHLTRSCRVETGQTVRAIGIVVTAKANREPLSSKRLLLRNPDLDARELTIQWSK